MSRTPACGLVAMFVLGAANASWAATAVGVKASPLGIGLELTVSLTESLNARVGGNFFKYTYSANEDDVEYDLGLKLQSFTGCLDFHPGGGSFRVTAGLVSNRNKLDATALASGTYDLGDRTYTASQVGSLTGSIEFKKLAPYAGIGFGNAVGQDVRVGFILDLGVVFQGSPTVTLRANGTSAADPQFQGDLREEQGSIQGELNFFKYYPVVALGFSIKF